MARPRPVPPFFSALGWIEKKRFFVFWYPTTIVFDLDNYFLTFDTGTWETSAPGKVSKAFSTSEVIIASNRLLCKLSTDCDKALEGLIVTLPSLEISTFFFLRPDQKVQQGKSCKLFVGSQHPEENEGLRDQFTYPHLDFTQFLYINFFSFFRLFGNHL